MIDGRVLPDDYLGHALAYVSAIPVGGEVFHAAQNYRTFRTGLTPPLHPRLRERFVRRMYEEYDNPGSRRGHFPFAEEPKRTQRWVVPFLRRQLR
jgi:hypothetical protein